MTFACRCSKSGRIREEVETALVGFAELAMEACRQVGCLAGFAEGPAGYAGAGLARALWPLGELRVSNGASVLGKGRTLNRAPVGTGNQC